MARESGPRRGYPGKPKGKRRCRARTRAGEQCRNYAVKGSTVCRMHGAGTRKRPGGRPATTGRRAKKLLTVADLYADIQRWRNDPDLSNILVDVAQIRALGNRNMRRLQVLQEEIDSLASDREAEGEDLTQEEVEAFESKMKDIEAALTDNHMQAGSLVAKFHRIVAAQKSEVTMDTLNRLMLIADQIIDRYVPDAKKAHAARDWFTAQLGRIVLPPPE